jgi:hypothetical protein
MGHRVGHPASLRLVGVHSPLMKPPGGRFTGPFCKSLNLTRAGVSSMDSRTRTRNPPHSRRTRDRWSRASSPPGSPIKGGLGAVCVGC